MAGLGSVQQPGSVFSEMHGWSTERPAVVPGGAGKVVWSSLGSGAARFPPIPALVLRHVARGEPTQQRIRGRNYRVRPGQFICLPERSASEVEIRPSGQVTKGFCIVLPVPAHAAEAVSALEAPVVLATACSAAGRLLDRHAGRLERPTVDRAEEGAALFGAIARALPALLAETLDQLGALDLTRPATRYDTLCRLNQARSLLHDVDDRAVPLEALARECGMSRFQLLRRFQACFGATPASYHRRLRLERAAAEIAAGRLSCSAAALRFGFADGSSFSHAFRRTFGRAPRDRG